MYNNYGYNQAEVNKTTITTRGVKATQSEILAVGESPTITTGQLCGETALLTAVDMHSAVTQINEVNVLVKESREIAQQHSLSKTLVIANAVGGQVNMTLPPNEPKTIAFIGKNVKIEQKVEVNQKFKGAELSGHVDDLIRLIDNSHARDMMDKESRRADGNISKQIFGDGTTVNAEMKINQEAQGMVIATKTKKSAAIEAEPQPLTLLLNEGFKLLMTGSLCEKNYSFQLKRVNANLLTITLVQPSEPSRADGRQLDGLQKELETCLKAAQLEYNATLNGENEEILTVNADKKVIDAIADLLVRQGLSMSFSEVSKYSAFFKAEKTQERDSTTKISEDGYIFTCAMQ